MNVRILVSRRNIHSMYTAEGKLQVEEGTGKTTRMVFSIGITLKIAFNW